MSKVAEIDFLQRQKKDIESKLAAKFRELEVGPGIAAVASQLLLSHEGRVKESLDDPGCCGVPDLLSHLNQVADPDSWVHSSMDKWIKRALSK